MLDNSDDVLELFLILAGVARAAAVGDDGCSQVSEDPWAGSLDGVDECWGEEKIADDIASRFVVEEGEQCPVDEPCSVVKLSERVAEELGLNRFLDFLHFFHGRFPISSQNFAGQFSPCCSRNLVVVGREDSELVEEFGGGAIVSTAILKVSKIVQDIDLLNGNLFNC